MMPVNFNACTGKYDCPLAQTNQNEASSHPSGRNTQHKLSVREAEAPVTKAQDNAAATAGFPCHSSE